MCVMAFARDQLVVAAVLDDAAVLHDDDLVGHAPGREAVRDQDRDAVLGEPAEVLEARSEESRVGQDGVSACSSRWLPAHSKKTKSEHKTIRERRHRTPNA